MQQQANLFKDRRFLPLFITQFCGCLNDCILKSALIILVIFKIASEEADLLILVINAIFILPFIVFAGLAGQISDKYEKSFLIKVIKFFEIFIVLLGIAGFYNSSITLLMISVTLMGIHSTFFGTLKFSLIPDQLKREELLKASGYIESATFVGVLIGNLFGGLYNWHPQFIITLMIVVALTGFVASLFLIKSSNYNSKIKINWNILSECSNILKYAYSKQTIFLSILGISWFWFLGASVLSQIPSLTKNIFGADEGVSNLFLAIFSVGVGIGSLWCNKLLNNEVTTKYVFNAAVGMAICGIDLFFAAKNSAIQCQPEELKGIIAFISKMHNWRILIDFLVFSILGGIYIVPLYAVIQTFSSANYRSRIVAANNLMNAIFMIISTLLLSILLTLGCSIPFLILIISLLNFMVSGYIYTFLPEVNILPTDMLRWLFKFAFDKFYKVEVEGLENFYAAGRRVVVISNHVSYLDAALLAIYIPEKPTFAINRLVAKAWWMRPLLKIVKTHPVDTNNPMAIKDLIKELKRNKKIVIFPEGRITTTGRLMKMYAGPVMIADKGRAVILPVRIEGPEYTIFSSLQNLPIKRSICKVKITILPSINIADDLVEVDHKIRLKKMSERLYEIMSETICKTTNTDQTIFSMVLSAAKIYGYNYQIIEDADSNKLNYRQLIAKSFILGEQMSRNNKTGSYVGLMMPNAAATFVSFLAMQAKGLIPTMVNFTAGSGSIISACKTVQIETIYTSRRFIEKANLGILAEELSQEFNIVFLEDIAQNITIFNKLKGIAQSFIPSIVYNQLLISAMSDKPAVTLFTSGTENAPKAVVLSHKNIAFNISQILARLDFNVNDKIFNALPMFHCFSLGATITSVAEGIKLFLYPSPLHYKIIPEAIYDTNPTIMFSTDTFLNGYAKFAHPYDLNSVRYVFAGAEKLKNHTKEIWQEKFGIRILEGYGTTETSPVISFNTRLEYKAGTVGKILPGIEYKLMPVEGIEQGGRLIVKGENVMLGYVVKDAPGVIQKPCVEGLGEGWYDTGDIVDIDHNKYIKILGRAKRFAKIGGEMVSLSLLEDIASEVDILAMCAAVSIEDDKKGEQIILFTTSAMVTKEKVLLEIRKAKISELYMPKSVVVLSELPVLATGKINYREILKIAIDYANQQLVT
jgi:acyl-[acyl-carrier-protein]-phospholipid O-acyltransferase/long-chain-fatty-acid--[acyl-carrier-protein] ligase